jgi:putative SOS response-associated peptidase YedK
MCGRIRLETDWSEIVRIFDLDPNDIAGFVPRYNVAPTQPVPLIAGPRGHRHARWGSWGYVPFWEKSTRPRARPINARCETVATNGMFKHAFASRRCLVPATGFYEWATLPDGKQPYLYARPDHGIFAIAGLWERWFPEGGDPVDTFCVLTTGANRVTGPVHDRMPVILPDARAMDLWTDPDANPIALTRLLVPAPDDLLVATPVSRRMNSPVDDTAEGSAPVTL